VYKANIYDASDGSGDLGPLFGNVPPCPLPPSSMTEWGHRNPVLARGQTLKDVRVRRPGLQSTSSWFVDCGHPNSLGHAALAQFLFLDHGH
jgi:hypothetical protein